MTVVVTGGEQNRFPRGLRPQARFGAQPPKAALSAEMKLSSGARLMRNTGGDLTVCKIWQTYSQERTLE